MGGQSDPPPDRGVQTDGLRASIGAVSATMATADQAVSVTIGPGGAVLDLHLGRHALRYSGTELGALIVELIGAGSEDVRHQLAAAVPDAVGHSSGLDAVLGTGPGSAGPAVREAGTA